MSTRTTTLLPFLFKLVGGRASNESDQELLARFIATEDAGAFQMLMDRHGPLVHGVCRRSLGNTHDADDAFQATFLVLVRSARSIRRLKSVGSWLHGVARRIAYKMRAGTFRRRGHEQQAAELRPTQHVDDMTLGELKKILDEEIENLPRNFREPLILCCLEGKSRDEAAQELGWSVGAVKGRLERARDALRVRLARRGLTLSAALFALTITQNTASAAVAPSLVAATVVAAVKQVGGQALTGLVSAQTIHVVQTTLHGMFLVKLKAAAIAVALVIGLSGAGAGLGVYAFRPGGTEPQEKNCVSTSAGVVTIAAEPLPAAPQVEGPELNARFRQVKDAADQAAVKDHQFPPKDKSERLFKIIIPPGRLSITTEPASANTMSWAGEMLEISLANVLEESPRRNTMTWAGELLERSISLLPPPTSDGK
jgi:RNA polymerase sigma factor (sigma-70 family)